MVIKFQISLDLLKNDKIYKFEEIITCEDLDITTEKELMFTKPLSISGKAYLADDTLIMTLNVIYYISLPCSICNEFFEKKFVIKNLTITESVSNINSVYDFKDEIRNACFLEIPSYVQCNDKCPKLENIKKYLNTTKENYPFSNLKEL